MAEGGGALREILAVFGFEVDSKGLKEGENHLEEFLGTVEKVGHAILGAFAVHELYEFAEANVHAMTAIEHSAAQIGVNEEAIQSWQFAAKSAGFEADKFTFAMSRLQVAQESAIQGTGQGAEEFKRLGVNVKDASGKAKGADQLFLDIADAISKTEDPAKRAGIVTKLFGRQGRELLPFLVKGKEGIGELLKKYKDLGGGYTRDAIEKTKEFEETQASLDSVWTRTKSTVLTALLPILTKISDWAAHAVKWFNDLTKNSKVFQSALVVLGAAGTVFAVQMAIAFAPILLATAGVIALIAVLDDLMVLFDGGDSVIGEWIDKAFGKGQSVEIVKELKYFWHELVAEVRMVAGWIEKVVDGYHELQGLSGKAGDWLAKKLEVGGQDLAYSIAHPNAPSTIEATQRLLSGNSPSVSNLSNEGGASTMNNEINITVNPSPGMDERKLAEHVGNQIDERLKHHRRAAKSTLPVSGQ